MSDHSTPFVLLKTILDISNSSLSLETKLDQMLQSISGALQSDRCLLIRPDQINANGFLSRLASEKKPLWGNEVSSLKAEKILQEEEDLLSPSLACIPLCHENTLQGVLYIGFLKNRNFSPQEIEALLLIAKVMEGTIWNAHFHLEAERTISELTALREMEKALSSASIENELTHCETSRTAQDLEKKVQQLYTLWEFNKALLTTVNLEQVIHMTLTAITIGDGLRFNRSMLFLVNEKEHTLEGTMAVGPDNAEEAGRIWVALSQRKGTPSELIAQLQSFRENNSKLNSMVKGIQIPLDQEQCILSKTVLEGKPFNIQSPHSEERWLQTRCERGCLLSSEVGCYVGEHLSGNPKVFSFATVPLWGKGKVIGVILVDNLYNQNPITEEDIQLLSMFSSQAGLAIENALLYRNLEEVHQELREVQALLVHREKMVALGEMSANIAHEIKNPLVSIGGFARRLFRAIPAEVPEKRYAQTIIEEVSRLEKILNDVLTFTREEPLVLQEQDLRNILEDSLSMISEGFHTGGIHLVKEFAEEIPKVRGDYQQLKQAFFNLITNAREAIKEKGTLSIRVHPFLKDSSSYVRVEVEDTGTGIDSENLHNIFNPFYTTKESNLGLGLPIVYKIVTSHQGQIEVDNHLGKGATFIVTFPTQEVENGKANGLPRRD